MTPADLDALARAATQTCTAGRGDCPACKARNALGAQGGRVLAMIAVIEAAKAMRADCDEYWSGNCMAVFDAALAALDKEQT